MPALLKVLFTLAMSSGGRKAIRALLRYLQSEDGKKLLDQARRVAAGPEAQRLGRQVARILRDAAEQAKTPENRRRARAAGRYLRTRRAR